MFIKTSNGCLVNIDRIDYFFIYDFSVKAQVKDEDLVIFMCKSDKKAKEKLEDIEKWLDNQDLML